MLNAPRSTILVYFQQPPMISSDTVLFVASVGTIVSNLKYLSNLKYELKPTVYIPHIGQW